MEIDLIRDLTLIAIWALAIGTLIQGGAHTVAWIVLRNQRDATTFGVTVKHRELSLAIKNLTRFAFDTLLVIAITWHHDFTENPILPVVFILVTVAAIAAAYYAVRFVLALRHENWGRIVTHSTFSEETASTIDQTASDVSDVKSRVKAIERKVLGRTRTP